MIYLVHGNDNTQKSKEIKKLSEEVNFVRVPGDQITRNAILAFASQTQLFGEPPVVVIENIISEGEDILDKEILLAMQESNNTFVLSEDKLTQVVIKKYQKFIKDTILCEKKEPVKNKANPFMIADMYAKRNKIGAWTAYIDLVDSGEAPEAISGMLFWKIKTLILADSAKPYSKNELAKASSDLVDIYHKGHSGEVDMKIALEKFILSTI